MSFLKTLIAVGAGVAAAKGMDKYKQVGGMAGLQDMMAGAGGSGAADQLGKLAEKFGIPGGADKIQDLLGSLSGGGAGASAAGAAGLGGLMASMQSAATAGSKQSADMMSAVFGGTPAGDAMENQAKLMIRAMIQAAKSDGEIDAGEQRAIMEHLGDMDDEERAFVQEELQRPIDIMGLANDTSEAAREQVYATSLSAIQLDQLSEAKYLQQLATALNLSDEVRDRIHEQLGVPTLG